MTVLSGLCSFHESDGCTYVIIGDDFAGGTWTTLEPVLQELIEQLQQTATRAVLLNLSSLSHTSSAVIAAVLRIWKKMVAAGKRFMVLAPTEETRATFRMAGLSGQLPTVQRAADAMHRLGLSDSARLKRRETLLLQCISPIAAAIAVTTLLVLQLSGDPDMPLTSMPFIVVNCAVMACCGGAVASVREMGLPRRLSRFISMTGFITLVSAFGHWSV